MQINKNRLRELSKQILIFGLGIIFFGGVFAAWNDIKDAGDILTAQDWNDLVANIGVGGLPTCTSGQILKYDNDNWICAENSGGIGVNIDWENVPLTDTNDFNINCEYRFKFTPYVSTYEDYYGQGAYFYNTAIHPKFMTFFAGISRVTSMTSAKKDTLISSHSTNTWPVTLLEKRCGAITVASGSSPWTENGDDVYRSDGKVGIGTDDPINLLTVKGNANSHVQGKFMNNSGYGVGIGSTENIGNIGVITANKNGEAIDLYIKTKNVGIGSTTPTEKLDVAGNIKASGTVCDKNGCIGSEGSFVCTTVKSSSQKAVCPSGYTVTGCGTYDSDEDSQIQGNSCVNNESHVWARCCKF